MLKKIFLLSLFFIFFSCNSFAKNQKFENSYISLELIPEYSTLQPASKELNLLLKITPKQDWHLYYQNQGDVGEPTLLTPSNDTPYFTPSTPIYSTPKKEVYEDIITSHIYNQTFYILYPIFIKDIHSLNTLKLDFDLSYSACNEECIADLIPLSIKLPISNSQKINERFINELSLAERTFPTPQNITYKTSPNTLTITLEKPLPSTCLTPYFISSTQKKSVLSTLPTTKMISPSLLEISFEEEISPLGLILCPSQSYITNISPSFQPIVETISPTPQTSDTKNTFIYHIIIAFLAGLILNLMPCVLPVLSLKALHLLKNPNTPNITSSLSYMLGVISSFITLAGILYYAKLLNQNLNWGFQLQSIGFNLFLLFLFFIIFLNLLDKIQLPTSFTNLINKLPSQSSFITGFFAVIVATPCTGPFMGTAIGYALMSSATKYFIIFFSLALGYALPYTLIELNPKLFSKFLPKTGFWMLRLKHFLAIPIGLTCLWLGWVIYGQLLIKQPTTEIAWQPYSKQQIETALKNHKPVFINFTAKWCLICLLNDKTTLSTKAFHDLAKQKNIQLYKADFTNKDKHIEDTLKSYNRNSIPLYVYYSPKNQHPQILPQILRLKDLEKLL